MSKGPHPEHLQCPTQQTEHTQGTGRATTRLQPRAAEDRPEFPELGRSKPPEAMPSEVLTAGPFVVEDVE